MFPTLLSWKCKMANYLKGNYYYSYWRDPFFTSMIMGGRVYNLFVKHPFVFVPASSHLFAAGEVDGAADDCWQIEANIWICFYSTSPPSLAGSKQQKHTVKKPRRRELDRSKIEFTWRGMCDKIIGKESRWNPAARWRTHPASSQKASSGI